MLRRRKCLLTHFILKQRLGLESLEDDCLFCCILIKGTLTCPLHAGVKDKPRTTLHHPPLSFSLTFLFTSVPGHFVALYWSFIFQCGATPSLHFTLFSCLMPVGLVRLSGKSVLWKIRRQSSLSI